MRIPFRGQADFADKLLSAMRYEFGGHIEKPAAKLDQPHLQSTLGAPALALSQPSPRPTPRSPSTVRAVSMRVC
jgi:hypothetical protein